jgi:hypothetical protein
MIWTEPSVAAAGGAAPVFVKSGEGDANKDASTNIAPSPVDGSDELARLARIPLGLDDPHRPVRTLVGVAHGGS